MADTAPLDRVASRWYRFICEIRHQPKLRNQYFPTSLIQKRGFQRFIRQFFSCWRFRSRLQIDRSCEHSRGETRSLTSNEHLEARVEALSGSDQSYRRPAGCLCPDLDRHALRLHESPHADVGFHEDRARSWPRDLAEGRPLRVLLDVYFTLRGEGEGGWSVAQPITYVVLSLPNLQPMPGPLLLNLSRNAQ